MVLPMSKAVVAVVALFYAVGYWNAFFNAVLYINDAAKQPLQVVLRSFVLQGVSVPGQVDVGSGQIATLAVQMAVMVIALRSEERRVGKACRARSAWQEDRDMKGTSWTNSG